MKITNEKEFISAAYDAVGNGLVSDLASCMDGEPVTGEHIADCLCDTLYEDFDGSFEITWELRKRLAKSMEYYT
jgi:hypothetical protein